MAIGASAASGATSTRTAPGYLLCVSNDECLSEKERNASPRRWSNVKARLAFCHVSQDGDDEGCLQLDRPPAPHQVEAMGEALGIGKRRHLTPEAQAKASSALERFGSAIIGPLAA